MNGYVAGWVNYFHVHNSTVPGSDIFWSGECSSTCGGDDRSKGFDRASGHVPGLFCSSSTVWEWSRSRYMPDIGQLASLEVKMIGKPYAGELRVRFDGGTGLCYTVIAKRAQNWKRGYGQAFTYIPPCSQLHNFLLAMPFKTFNRFAPFKALNGVGFRRLEPLERLERPELVLLTLSCLTCCLANFSK